MADMERQRHGRDDRREHLSDEVLNAYCDRAIGLDPAARVAAEAHLVGCPACREALADLETTILLVRGLPQVAPRRSFALTPEAAAAVGGPRQPRRPFAWVWPVRWATALVTLLLALTIGLDISAGSGAAAVAPTATANAGTAAQATATSTCLDDPILPQPGCVTSFTTGTVVILPTPTSAPAPAPVPAIRTTTARVNWRPAQFTLGVLAALGAGCGFLLPPVLRRRQALSL